MASILYPSPSQLDTLVTWVNEGPQALTDPENPRVGTGQDSVRDLSLRRLNALIVRLDMPYKYQDLLADVHRRPIEELNEELRNEMTRVCRFYGYLHRHGHVTGKVAQVPLKAQAINMIRLISHGDTAVTVGRKLYVHESRVRRVLVQATKQARCSTIPHLVATMYTRCWFPGPLEMERILATGPVTSVGYFADGADQDN